MPEKAHPDTQGQLSQSDQTAVGPAEPVRPDSSQCLGQKLFVRFLSSIILLSLRDTKKTYEDHTIAISKENIKSLILLLEELSMRIRVLIILFIFGR